MEAVGRGSSGRRKGCFGRGCWREITVGRCSVIVTSIIMGDGWRLQDEGRSWDETSFGLLSVIVASIIRHSREQLAARSSEGIGLLVKGTQIVGS